MWAADKNQGSHSLVFCPKQSFLFSRKLGQRLLDPGQGKWQGVMTPSVCGERIGVPDEGSLAKTWALGSQGAASAFWGPAG